MNVGRDGKLAATESWPRKRSMEFSREVGVEILKRGVTNLAVYINVVVRRLIYSKSMFSTCLLYTSDAADE